MLTDLGRRWTAVVLAGLLTPLLLAGIPGQSASAAAAEVTADTPGPAMLTSGTDRANALTCYGVLEEAARPPVLLIHGTSLTPEENWGPTYLPVLLDRGHAVCTVRLPQYATRDVQASVEYVATAIRTMADRSSRRISVIGHSQGALLPRVALRTWPDLPAHVDDVIGIAGVYDRGSDELARRCQYRCVPVLHQLATGSAFLAGIRRRPLPDGPSYTNIGTSGDLMVTPQPAANQQAGATSVIVQDVCPGRIVPGYEHAMIIGDSVALRLTLDALDNDGPAAPARLAPSTCQEQAYPAFNEAHFLAATAENGTRLGVGTTGEPALYCRSQASCRYPRLRGFVTTGTAYTIGRGRVTVRTQALLPGRIRLALGNRTVEETVRPGPVTLRIRRPAGRAQLVVSTRPRYYTAWAAEATKWIRERPAG